MRTLIESLEQRVLLTDGAAARRLRDEDLDVGRDFFGAEGLLAVLNLTRPELVRRIHEAYLEAGAASSWAWCGTMAGTSRPPRSRPR